jgi:class 3 adenylate cyclase
VAGIRNPQFDMNPGTEQHRLAADMFTDMVDSTALKQHSGDKAGLQLLGKHYELLRQILRPQLI